MEFLPSMFKIVEQELKLLLLPLTSIIVSFSHMFLGCYSNIKVPVKEGNWKKDSIYQLPLENSEWLTSVFYNGSEDQKYGWSMSISPAQRNASDMVIVWFPISAEGIHPCLLEHMLDPTVQWPSQRPYKISFSWYRYFKSNNHSSKSHLEIK